MNGLGLVFNSMYMIIFVANQDNMSGQGWDGTGKRVQYGMELDSKHGIAMLDGLTFIIIIGVN